MPKWMNGLGMVIDFPDRTHDFEGRCSECGKPLTLYVYVVTQNTLVLRVDECGKHPGKDVILWPQREDVIRIREGEHYDR